MFLKQSISSELSRLGTWQVFHIHKGQVIPIQMCLELHVLLYETYVFV